MFFLPFVAVATCVLGIVTATPKLQHHVLHQKRSPTPRWVKRDRVHRDATLPVRIGMVQDNLDKGHDILMDISHPDSPNYSKHMTAEQVIELFAPPPHRVDAIHSWLTTSGIEAHRISQSDNKQWMQLDLTTSEAEALLGTKFHYFEHVGSGKTTVACDEYHVHKDVAHHIDYITPGIQLRAPRRKIKKRLLGPGGGSLPPNPGPPPRLRPGTDVAGDLAYCASQIEPACIMAMYNITKGTFRIDRNELGVFEDLAEYYTQKDLDLFFSNLYPTIPNGTHPVLDSIDGGPGVTTNVSAAGGEANLDFQIAYPIVWPQNQILYDTDDRVYQADYTYTGFFNNFLDAIDGSYCDPAAEKLDPSYPHNVPNGYNKAKQCGVFNSTYVISLSYGGQEFDVPTSYLNRQCAEYMKLGLQGVSVVVASGDDGVAGPPGDDNANGCLGSNAKVFSPGDPATCPYVTTVGATTLKPGGSAVKDEETATTQFGSGGGFSNTYAIPEYQKSAVTSWLDRYGNSYKSYNGSTYGDGVYNRTGRGFPDVAAVGQKIFIYNKGVAAFSGGTSASTPVFGAILSRINGERLKAGKKPVGFVNPVLYANTKVFHDITQGNNPGCGTKGFNASTGWDPVTGLGTPNYPDLLALFMSLA